MNSCDWALDRRIFQTLMRKFPWMQIDLFASQTNNQLPRYPVSASEFVRGSSSTDNSTTTGAGCVGNFRPNGEGEPLSQRFQHILQHSIRISTSKDYASAWKTFVCRCSKRKIYPLRATLSEMLNYVAFLEDEKKLAYQSINLH
ncbi:unnamed protein product [Orchesella dallaii]|uniref:Core-binding (CB) domain-containing protein n=1 Tax=Orchesella dallaii TaxID=48710 RepID=A0ABP1SAJ9_9HEXA